jgi:signal transduction histidine kinase
LGVLLVAGSQDRDSWSPAEREVIAELAVTVARAIDDVARPVAVGREVPALPAPADVGIAGRMITLEKERDTALSEAVALRDRLQRAEAIAAQAEQQARDLSATAVLTVGELSAQPEGELRQEVATLRESLAAAEEALALASAGEGGLSPEWVMLAITRYSGELEDAQARLHQLEARLAETSQRGTEALASLVEELRAPLTMIKGHTDLLLGETLGILGTRQMSQLRRARAGIEQMEALLGQAIESADGGAVTTRLEPATVHEVVEAAASAILPHIQARDLRLELQIGPELPALSLSRRALYEIVLHLLTGACLTTPERGWLRLTADNKLDDAGEATESPLGGFLQLVVAGSGDNDGGGQSRPATASGLAANGRSQPWASAQALVAAQGGRLWVGGSPGPANSTTVLLPAGLAPGGATE